MKDEYKTKEQLLNELLEMRQRVAELEKSEAELKQVEEAIQKSEATFRTLTQTNAAAIVIYQGDKLQYVNPATETLTGYTKEELLKINFWDIIHPEFRELVKERWLARLRGEKVGQVVEFKITTKSGKMRWLSVSEGIIELEGEPAGIGTAFDITDRKRLEDSLRVQKDKFEGIITSLTDGLDIVKRDYRIDFQNKMLRDRFGNMAGKFCYEVYMGRETPCDVCPMVKAIATGCTQKLETTSIDGREYEVTSIPFQDIDGETKAIEIVRDITEHKQTEKALVESEERYRRIVSAITAYTYSVEFREGQAVFTRHSIGCLPITGYKPEDYESEPYLWYTMIHPEDQILVGKSLNEIMAGRGVPPIEHRLIRRDGSTVWVRNTMVPYIDEEGRLTRYDGLIEDITERKIAE
jgi:PAS domain S-box-containing protein